jgi:hypothetical protein
VVLGFMHENRLGVVLCRPTLRQVREGWGTLVVPGFRGENLRCGKLCFPTLTAMKLR